MIRRRRVGRGSGGGYAGDPSSPYWAADRAGVTRAMRRRRVGPGIGAALRGRSIRRYVRACLESVADASPLHDTRMWPRRARALRFRGSRCARHPGYPQASLWDAGSRRARGDLSADYADLRRFLFCIPFGGNLRDLWIDPSRPDRTTAQRLPHTVIPANAGIQCKSPCCSAKDEGMDSSTGFPLSRE